MTPERWDRISTIFGEAAELAGPEREEYLRRACEDEPELHAQVLELLQRHDQEEAFVDRPAAGFGWAARMAATHAFAPGEVIAGRFRVESFIGEGGMGEVYAALDTELNTRVAMKTMRSHLAMDEHFADRFRREVQIARQVTHPNICRIFDAGRHAGLLYLTMELIEGDTLAARIAQSGPLAQDEALAIIRQLCAGLAAAHSAGVVHRDLKPGNIILCGQRAVITDFGLARHAETPGAAVSTGAAIGTPAYMAPEQMEGAAPGPAADIYALGVVMYEMITGHRPFGDDLSPLALAVKKVKDQPTPLRHWTDVPPQWERVILKCMALEPAARFASATEVAVALDGGVAVEGPAARGARRGAAVQRRRWLPAAALVAACVAGVWGLNTWYLSRLRPPAGVEAWYREGVHALHDGNPSTAGRALARVTERAPAWAAGYARLAQAYKELDQPDRARESILQALNVLSVLDPAADLVKAVQSQVTLDYPAAAARFRRIAERQSGADRLDAMVDYARALELADQPAEAGRVLGEILAENPDAPTANLMRAQLGSRLLDTPAFVRTRFDRAIAGFRSLSRVEALSQGQLELSKWLYQQKETPEALKLAATSLESARAAQSRYAETQTLFHLARLSDSTADRAAASDFLRQARAIAQAEHFGELEVQGFIDLGVQLFT